MVRAFHRFSPFDANNRAEEDTVCRMWRRETGERNEEKEGNPNRPVKQWGALREIKFQAVAWRTAVKNVAWIFRDVEEVSTLRRSINLSAPFNVHDDVRRWHDVNDTNDVYRANGELPRGLATWYPHREGENRDREWKAIYSPPNERTCVLPSSILFFSAWLRSRESTLVSIFTFYPRHTGYRCGRKKSANFYNTKALGRIVLTTGINRVRLSPVFSRCAFLNYGSNCNVNTGTWNWVGADGRCNHAFILTCIIQ